MLLLVSAITTAALIIRIITLSSRLYNLHRKYDELYEEHRPLAIQLRETSHDDWLSKEIEEVHNRWRYGENYTTLIRLKEFKEYLEQNKSKICKYSGKKEWTRIDYFSNNWAYNMAANHTKDSVYMMTEVGMKDAIYEIDRAINNIEEKAK